MIFLFQFKNHLGAFLLYGLAIFALFSCFCRILSLFSNKKFFAFLLRCYFLVYRCYNSTICLSVMYLYVLAALCSLDLIDEKTGKSSFYGRGSASYCKSERFVYKFFFRFLVLYYIVSVCFLFFPIGPN